MKRINLLPKSEQKEIKIDVYAHQFRNFWLWVIASMIVLFALSVLTSAQLNSTISETERGIAENKQSLRSAANQQLEKQVVTLNNEIKKISELRTQHYRWSNGLIELGNILGSDMVIDLLTLDRQSGKVQVSGTAGNRDSVIKFWSDMHKNNYFKDIDFPLNNLEKASDTPFTFTFFINEAEIVNQ